MKNPEDDLLANGAKYYIEALTAIEAFEEKVRGVCRHSYKHRQRELVGKLLLKDGDCEDYKELDPANRSAQLGIKQRTTDKRKDFFVYLSWDEADNGSQDISACVCLEFSTAREGTDFANTLPSESSFIQRGDFGGSFWSQKKLSDLSSCNEAFVELLDEWLKVLPDPTNRKKPTSVSRSAQSARAQ